MFKKTFICSVFVTLFLVPSLKAEDIPVLSSFIKSPVSISQPQGKITPMDPKIEQAKDGILLENSHFSINLQTSPTLKIRKIFNKYTASDCLIKNKSSALFIVWKDDKKLNPDEFTVTDTKIESKDKTKKAILSLAHKTSKIKGILSVSVGDSQELTFSLNLTNEKSQPVKLQLLYPYIQYLMVGDKADDNYYYFPFKAGWAGNGLYDLRVLYGQHAGGMQLMALFNPNLGGGVSTWLKDNTGRNKYIILRKLDEEDMAPYTFDMNRISLELKLPPDEEVFSIGPGVEMAFYLMPFTVKPGETLALPDSVLQIYSGEFKPVLKSYSKWAHTWFKYDLKVPEWRKNCFSYVVSHDAGGNTGYEKGFIKDNKIVLSELYKPEYEHFIETAFWWQPSKTDGENDTRTDGWYKHTIPQYSYDKEWAKAWKDETKKIHDKGGYLKQYVGTIRLGWKYSEIVKKHPEWVQIEPDGKPSAEYSGKFGATLLNYYDMCGQLEGWQDYNVEEAKKVVRDTGCDAIFLDVMNEIKFCYDPNHKHEEFPAKAAEKYLKKIRSAIRSVNPEATVDIEDYCSDYLMQFTDASWAKTFDPGLQLAKEHDIYSIHFIRFYFPEIKFAEWGTPFADGCYRSFFNGIGFLRNELKDLKNDITGEIITVQKQIEFQARAGDTLKENGDAINSLDVEPLVPTLKRGVLANRFSIDSKTIFTLYNKNKTNVSGETIEVDHKPGYRYVELLYDEEVPVKINGNKATLSVSIKPLDVVCVAKLPKIMETNKANKTLNIKLAKTLSAPSLRLLVNEDSGKEKGKEIILKNNSVQVNLQDYQGERLIVKLFEGNYLIDERIVELK